MRLVDYNTKNLSNYKTLNKFELYYEFKSTKELKKYLIEIKKLKKNYIILGNGSNIFFSRKKIKTAILKNKIPAKIEKIDNDLYEVSSSTKTHQFLKFCLSNQLDSFYFLSSVPSTIGGNIAMNAGGGIKSKEFISNYIDSIKILKNNEEFIIKKEDSLFNYRSSIFSGQNNIFIISVTFHLKKKKIKSNPMLERIQWSQKFQDYKRPNCGSVFKFRNRYVAWLLRGLTINGAGFSSKTQNWIWNTSESPFGINFLINFCKLINYVFLTKAELEIIKIK